MTFNQFIKAKGLLVFTELNSAKHGNQKYQNMI